MEQISEVDVPPPKRKIDTTSRDAKRAVAEVVEQFGPWRISLARIDARAEHRLSPADRTQLEKECEEIEQAIRQARTEVILQLAEAPQKVTSHSRVVDIERAFDNIEATLAHARMKLGAGERVSCAHHGLALATLRVTRRSTLVSP